MTKVRTVKVEHVLSVSAQAAWDLMVQRFGDVSCYASDLVSSRMVTGIEPGKEGCVRRCDFDARGKTQLVERLADIDRKKMTFSNVITEARGLPMVPHLAKTSFRIVPLGADTCRVEVDVHIATKPSFLSFFLRGMSKKQMRSFLLGVEHYINTGEEVTKTNIKDILKRKQGTVPVGPAVVSG